MEQEIGENIITKHGHKWKLIKRLRRDFANARGEEEKSALGCLENG